MLHISMVSNPHLKPFTDFLRQQKDYKTINLDQWQGFGRFTQEVSFKYVSQISCFFLNCFESSDDEFSAI